MKPLTKHTLLIGGLLSLASLTSVAVAQQANPPEPGNPTAPASAATASDLPWAEAEVRRVDTAAGKISLRHGEIKNLDMPPMSMVFQVRDPAKLDKVKAGDQIRFTADKINGAYTVIDLQVAP